MNPIMTMFHRVALAPLALILLLFPARIAVNPAFEATNAETEAAFWDFLGQTSAGVASGPATPDGRPLLWKSRDRGGDWPMEFRYYDDGRIPFVGYTTNDNLPECYGGINIEGFAIGNTDAHNFRPNGPHNDGRTMYEALAVCRTLDDFDALLDSADAADLQGRYGYNYLAFDAYGGAAVFEASRNDHVRIDAVAAADGFLIRSNFAHTGPNPGDNDGLYGIHRHNRAYTLWKNAVDSAKLTPIFILQSVARDLSRFDLDPHPLPFEGYYSNYEYGLVPNDASICRNTTSAVLVAQGVRDGDRPDDAVLWSMIGNPIAGITTPLWVRAGSVPVEYDGPNGSRLNNRIIALKSLVDRFGRIDTWRLINPWATGLWDFILPLERWMFDKTTEFMNSPQFDYDQLRGFQTQMAAQIADSMDAWRLRSTVLAELAEPVFWENNVVLTWGQIQLEVGGRDVDPRGYAIYRSPHPFREEARGDSVAFTADTQWVDSDYPRGGAYYRVEAVFE